MGISSNEQSMIMWLHVLAGITWIGLLYYFNFVQVPALAAAAQGSRRPGRRRHQQVRRAARAALVPLGRRRHLADGRGLPLARWAVRRRVHCCRPAPGLTIGIGAWLGTIMLFNVWVLIWPNQKKVLGLGRGHGRRDRQSAPRRVPRFAHQHDAVDPDAHEHGRVRPRRVLPLAVARNSFRSRTRQGASFPGPRRFREHNEKLMPPPALPADIRDRRQPRDRRGPRRRRSHGRARSHAHTQAAARVIAREPATLCGRAWFDETFRQLDPRVAVAWHAADGDADRGGQRRLRAARPGAQHRDRRAHGAELPANAVGHGDGHALPTPTSSRARARASSTRARRCRVCASRKSTPCAAAAARITASACSTPC